MYSVSTLDEATSRSGNNCSKKAKRAHLGLSVPSCCPKMPSTESEITADHFFPVEDVVQHPLPGYVAPSSVAFSPDDSLVSYLYSPDLSLSRNVFAFDPSTCLQQLLVSSPDGGLDECNLSTSEKLRRERLRERGLGVTRYEWAKSGFKPCLMVPLPGGIYIQDHPAAELRLRIASSPCSPIIDPHLSPDGSSIAYVRDDELYVASVTSGDPVQLTFGARDTGKTHGLAEYIAQEEMERRSGFWWSPDSRLIAYTEVDATHIPNFRIVHQGKAVVGGEAQEDHPYPFAGTANVKVRLGVVSVAEGGATTWVDLHCGNLDNKNGDEEYLARVAWMPDNSLTAQVQNRLQTKLKLLKFDVTTGARQLLLVEENGAWVNLHDCFTPLQKGFGRYAGGFLWASESSGFRHLYLHDSKGCCLGQLTEGNWMVEQVAGIDENSGLVYFTATFDSPIETHLYSAKLLPSSNCPLEIPRRLTEAAGRHVVVLDHQMQRFVDMHDSMDMPPRVLLCSLETGKVVVPIYEQPAATRTSKLNLTLPEILQITSNDGTTLYGALYKPDLKEFGPPPYKTVVSVYGGPNVQTVADSWMMAVDMRAQYLRSRGLLVWKLDNRGSARRGLKFESSIKHRMGRTDVEDQEKGIQWLIRQGLAKAGQVGAYGWSYGGYMAAMMLARCPDLLTCAVAGAPVTSWDGYDTYYTEKYMGTPEGNSENFEFSSVMHHAHKIQGKLLLVHGMIDENVHFRHTARLINALIAAGKEYNVLVFPDERHMPRGLSDRIYMEERICDFLEKHLSI